MVKRPKWLFIFNICFYVIVSILYLVALGFFVAATVTRITSMAISSCIIGFVGVIFTVVFTVLNRRS